MYRVSLEKLIGAVRERGRVKLKSGEVGVPRKVKITPEGDFVVVDTAQGRSHISAEEVEETVFVGRVATAA